MKWLPCPAGMVPPCFLHHMPSNDSINMQTPQAASPCSLLTAGSPGRRTLHFSASLFSFIFFFLSLNAVTTIN